MSNATLMETGISYGTSDDMKAILIGLSSKFDITTESREFEGINKITVIEETPTIKITFYQLTDNLITYLQNSTMAANGVRFWNKTGLHDGIYQSFYEQDEFKQTATLTLYFCYSLVHEISWEGNLIDLGIPIIFPYGYGNLKINSFEFPQNRINAEKNINIDLEKHKFGNKYRYFISSKSSYKITIHDLSIYGITLEHLAALKNSMIEFTPHIDRPDKTYSNLYLSYEAKEENNIISAEVSLKAISDQTNQDFVFAPSIYQSGNFIMMTAGTGAKIYYTYGATSTPSNPVLGNWTEYTAHIELANGFYKAIAVLNGKFSGITEKQITAIIVSKPVLLVVDNKLQMTADSNAEIFYNSNKYSLPGEPGAGSSKYPGTPIDLVYAYYKAIAKLNGLWSNVTSAAISPSFIPAPNIWKYTENTIKMECSLTDAEIFYTTDGSVPTANSTKYTQPIPFAYGEYKAVAKLVETKSYINSYSPTKWTPINISTVLWLDAADLSTISKDSSNFVSQWNDKSGFNKNALAYSDQRPQHLNNKIVFDGVNDYMLTEGKNIFNAASDVTIYILHKAHTINSNGGGVLSLQNGLNDKNGFFHTIYRNNVTNSLRGVFSSDGDTANMSILYPNVQLLINTDYIIGHGASSSSQFIRTNGIESYATRVSQCVFNEAKANIGCYYSSSYYFDGEISEIIILNNLAALDIKQKIEGYLAWKWDGINGNSNLVLNLPADHPYKSSAPLA